MQNNIAPKISVVVGTCNQKNVLKLTLESLFHQTMHPSEYEIILVDSSSNDGTDKMIKTLTSPDRNRKPAPCFLKYLQVENRGKSAARNQGIKKAQAEIILFTDADMLADPNLIKKHLRAHEKHQNASFEGLTYNLKFGIRNSEFEANLNCQIPNDQKEPYIKNSLKGGQRLKWAYFLSGNLSVKKEALLQAGLFDEEFSVYGWEDIELGYRLNKMKIPLYYLPAAVNYHNHFVGNEDMLIRKFNMGKSAALFYKKHPNFEIKMFLGINPVAMEIYKFLKNRPKFLGRIAEKATKSKFYHYILEEYYYRKGLMET